MKDLNSVIIGDAISPTEWNHERDEVQNLVENTAQSLAPGDPNQMAKAVAAYAAAGDFYTMSGTGAQNSEKSGIFDNVLF